MKPFQFRNKTSQIRIVQEPKLKKKKWSFDRLTYFGVIIAIALVALNFTYKSINVINGNGQIVFNKLTVNFTDDIRLKEIMIQEGDTIEKGDTLFVYEIEDNIDNNINLSLQRAETQSQFNGKALEIQRDILAKEAELKGLKLLLKQQRMIYDEKVKMVLLEIESSSVLDNLKLEQQKLLSRIEILEIEIAQLKKIKGGFRSIGNQLAAAYEPQNEIEYFRAPVSGKSGQVKFANDEVCYREQEVLAIHDQEQVEIQAFFKPKFKEHLKEGQVIKVKFPDGTTSKGKIKQSLVATYAVPSEFQKKYESTERNIVVSIVPFDESAESLWKTYYLMEVELTIFRFGFGF